MVPQKPVTVLTISLPREMAQQVETVRKVERRTRSELVREARRHYLKRRLRVEVATPAEVKAIERGRRATAQGDTITLAEYVRELETRADESRQKKS